MYKLLLQGMNIFEAMTRPKLQTEAKQADQLKTIFTGGMIVASKHKLTSSKTRLYITDKTLASNH